MKKIKIRQIRSIIDRPERHKRTIEALGLGRPNWEKIHNDTPQIRGMIFQVSHLVDVSEYTPTTEEKEKPKPVEKKKAAAKKTSSAKTKAKPKAKTKKESKSKK